MKTLAVALAACMIAANASACPELDAFASHHGISFSGFLQPIPVAKGPAMSEKGRLVRLRMGYPLIVSDGFRHTVLFDATARKAWILRTGGFAGVHELYGPVEVGNIKLENCKPESEPNAPESTGIERAIVLDVKG